MVPLPVIAKEIPVSSLKPGATLAVTTESHVYNFAFKEGGRVMLTTTNPSVLGGWVVIHGSWDHASSSPRWGFLCQGLGVLFAHHPNVQSATKTSPASKIIITSPAPRPSPAVPRPVLRHPLSRP